jgi:hypothetical protein
LEVAKHNGTKEDGTEEQLPELKIQRPLRNQTHLLFSEWNEIALLVSVRSGQRKSTLFVSAHTNKGIREDSTMKLVKV